MANIGRKLGVNIFTLMQNSGISREDLAVKLNYTYRDMCRILEGRVMLSPVEIEKIAGALGKTKKELLDFEADKLVPELQYMKEFNNTGNLDKILDLLDDYVELKEVM
ncbi:MAG: helix-turn-helix transcriptional regulator [Lachnospiraceae bacterium]|jgi:transcriptional regulator with XRE-family HTH domain|nr:helix-turn-helix transcriptional regulator [Lachnospiraceae bacterium]